MRYSGQFWAVPAIVIMATTAHAADRIAPGTEARNAKAAFVYLSQATKDAALKPLDAALIEQRKRADALNAKLAETRNQLALARKDASASKSRLAELERLAQQAAIEAAEAQEKFTQELAAKDEDYARELAILRSAADDILATPEGLKYLEANNAGDLDAADAIEEKLIAARQKMRDLQAAADRRAFAVVALDNRNKGKRTTEAVIARYEEVTRLDPGNNGDWITLARLYTDIGKSEQAIAAAQRAQETARNPLQKAYALIQIGQSFTSQGDTPNALMLFDEALREIGKADAAANDVLDVLGNIQILRGDALMRSNKPALAAYIAGADAKRKLIEFAPDAAKARFNLANALRQLGQGQRFEDDDAGSKASMMEAIAIMDKLIAEEPANTSYRRFKASLLLQPIIREGDSAKAITLSDTVIADLAPVAAADGNHAYTLVLLLRAYSIKGSYLTDEEQYDLAVEALMRAKQVGATLLEKAPEVLHHYSWVRSNYVSLTDVLNRTERFSEALMSCEEAKAVVLDSIERNKAKTGIRLRNEYFHSWFRYECGLSLVGLGRAPDARQEFLAAFATMDGLLARGESDEDFVGLQGTLLVELAELKEPGFTWSRAIAFMEAAPQAYPEPPDFADMLEYARDNAKRDGEILP